MDECTLKRNVIIKIFLDIAMIILYALLMFAQGLGGFFHETAGIGTGILFVIHVAMNYSMIKGLFKSVKNGTAKGLKLILLFFRYTACCMYASCHFNRNFYSKRIIFY